MTSTASASSSRWPDDEHGVGELEPVGVREEFRRRGLGAAVCSHALRRWHDAGGRQAIVYCATEPACALYESMGFRKHATLREYSRRAVHPRCERGLHRASVAPASYPSAVPDSDSPLELCRRCRDAFFARDVEAILALVTPEFVFENVTAGERVEGWTPSAATSRPSTPVAGHAVPGARRGDHVG